ncbi:MAG: right-handed parallel beta-helix repeat-containing protein, partial [Planctomycetes bacterium]|nr:right-handed parallel beta-helix repeat-containing protein [Planctomycetota bacterium]
DNYFSSQMNGILIEGDNKAWYESGAVQDVTITNNVFENSGFGGGPVYPLFASPMLTPQQRLGDGRYHRNINFVNNTVKSFSGHMVFARSVKGLNIAGNTLEFSTDYPAVSDFASIDLHYCDEVVIKDNKIEGFDRPVKISRSSDSTNVTIDRNDGFETQ